MKFISTIASLVACASAYSILTPTLNSTVAKGSNVNVQFSSVDTDPSTFSVYLVNFQTGHFPPEVISLAQGVQRSAGSVTVRIPCSVSSDYGYQLNFINGTNTYVIYAQSPKFSLTGDCTDPVAPANTPAFSNSSIGAVNVNVVTTVVYQNPVVWFVQPSNLIQAAAICPPAAQGTVTVVAAAAAAAAVTVVSTVVSTVTVCPTVAAATVVVTAAAAVGTPAVAAANVVTAAAAASTSAKAAAVVVATPAVVAAVVVPSSASSTNATLPAVSRVPSTGIFTSGASSIQSGGVVVGLIVAAFAMLF